MTATENVSLSLESLRSSVPAIFATAPAPGVSEHYQFVSTLLVLTPMLAEGWHIHRAKQQAQSGPYGSHEIILRNDQMPSNDEGHCEFIIHNSHDRTRRLFLGCGYFRMVCSNGLVIMTSGLMKRKMTHLDTIIKIPALMEAVNETVKLAPSAMGRIEEFRKKELTSEQTRLFADAALKSRYGAYTPTVSTEGILSVHRPADEGNTLWKVLNRVQENLMHGVFEGKRHSKPITSLIEQTRVNKKAWELAESFMNN